MKHLKLFFALFAMLALGVGNAWGAEESFTIHDKFTSTTMAYPTTYTADVSVSDLNWWKFYCWHFCIRSV